MSAAAKFRERVTFYTPGQTVQDEVGGMVPASAETGVTHWARIQALPAKEDLINGKISYRQPYKVTVRFTSGLSSSDRMEWNGHSISITSIWSDERNTEIYLYGYGDNH
ncbi:phage head closure protein [Hymenobacter sp. M29]|uniref:Phage head closure protein n=1 Tax=Hymenobacter mellowenesis TaxID=3063995 RepID=A0ABT9AD41_9BACT|nr:phage head closure protein [Hymenobacter sp. M29]MDO7847458.1 phage head closure protein [Hymenobacter sp. M29]